MENKGVFKDSLVTGVKAPVKLAENLATSPIKTTTHIVKGTGGFISNVGTIGGRHFLKNRDNMIVLPLPVDYIFWTETVAAKLQAFENGLARIKNIKGKKMWITGKVEHNAGIHFADQGWKIIQDVNNRPIK